MSSITPMGIANDIPLQSPVATNGHSRPPVAEFGTTSSGQPSTSGQPSSAPDQDTSSPSSGDSDTTLTKVSTENMICSVADLGAGATFGAI